MKVSEIHMKRVIINEQNEYHLHKVDLMRYRGQGTPRDDGNVVVVVVVDAENDDENVNQYNNLVIVCVCHIFCNLTHLTWNTKINLDSWTRQTSSCVWFVTLKSRRLKV